VTATDAQTNTYVWGLDLSGSLQGAGGIGGLITATFDSSNTVFYVHDANGNVTELLDDSGATVAEYVYDPFGATVSMTGTMATQNVYRFSSKCFDEETGLYYYGYRYYSPTTGRWPSRDPIGERGSLPSRERFDRYHAEARKFAAGVGVERAFSFLRLRHAEEQELQLRSFDLYQFVANDPVSKYDALGLWTVTDCMTLHNQGIANLATASSTCLSGCGGSFTTGLAACLIGCAPSVVWGVPGYAICYGACVTGDTIIGLCCSFGCIDAIKDGVDANCDSSNWCIQNASDYTAGDGVCGE